MYRILVAVDEDEERAAAQVDTLLSLPGDPDELSATVLHVYEGIETQPDEAGPQLLEEITESLPDVRDPPASVELVEDRLAGAGVATNRREMAGSPADAIVGVAAELDADAVLLGVRKRSPVGKAVFGSVSQRVILEADRPVIIAE